MKDTKIPMILFVTSYFIFALYGLDKNLNIFERITFKGDLYLSDIFTIIFTSALVYFAYQTFKHNSITAELNKEMVDLNERYVWLTGAMESHSQLMLEMRAEELHIPVIKWDPNKEKDDDNSNHRDIHVMRFIKSYVPMNKRSEGSKETAPEAEETNMAEVYSEHYKQRHFRNKYRERVKEEEEKVVIKEAEK